MTSSVKQNRRLWLAGVAAGIMVATGGSGIATAKHFNAGQISSEAQAAAFCPKVCAKYGRVWNGSWRPMRPGKQADCGCSKNDNVDWAMPALPVRGPGTSCTAPTITYCSGCSVSCPAGEQATCTQGTPLNDNQSGCWTAASCRCE